MQSKWIKKTGYIGAISLTLSSGIIASAELQNTPSPVESVKQTVHDSRTRDLVVLSKEQKSMDILDDPKYELTIQSKTKQLANDLVSYTYYNDQGVEIYSHFVKPMITASKTTEKTYIDKQSFTEHISKVKILLMTSAGNIKDTEQVFFSTTKPFISGTTPITITQGSDFDPMKGISAYSKKDGNLTDKIIHDSVIDKNTLPGTYTITYAVSDSDGNISQKTRSVIVKSSIESPIINVVNDKDTQLTGFGTPGATVNIYSDGQLLGTTTVDGDGRWTLHLETSLKEGTKVEASQVINGEESEKVSQIVSHLSSETINFFKYGYLQSYGLILEGSIDNGDLDLSNKDSIKKTINLVNETGDIVQSSEVANTDWYNPGVFNGYQAMLTNEMLATVKEGSYKLTVTLTVGDFTKTQDLNVSNARYVGHTIFDQIESLNTGTNTVKTVNKGGIGYLNITNN